MKEATPRDGSRIALHPERWRVSRRKVITRCSVCTCRIWFDSVVLQEPEDVPTPRLTWRLCKGCYHALLTELRRSPVHSPLRLRIAVGMVASERWPQAYPTRVKNYIYDRRWIVFMAAGFIIAMLLHLAIIVMVATMK
jgi:hypothetical protein